MLSTLLISFREFLEAFLIIGVFLGISKKLELKREVEIMLATVSGIIISFGLSFFTFYIGNKARIVLTEKNADLLESYLMIFSGLFIAYVVFSLHKFFALKRSKDVLITHQKLQKNIFDISLFFTIVFFIVREGFEIALFTATTSLFSKFAENMMGLALGFVLSTIVGTLTYFAYLKFSISKIYKMTEYLIVLLGASFVKNGIVELLEINFKIHLDEMLPIKLNFLPNKESFIGHFLNNFVGLERNYSLPLFAIMAIYIIFVYFFLSKKLKKTNEP